MAFHRGQLRSDSRPTRIGLWGAAPLALAMVAGLPGAAADEPAVAAMDTAVELAEPAPGSLATLPVDELSLRLRALATSPVADPLALTQLAEVAKKHAGNPAVVRDVARALGSIRTRASANLLISLLSAARDSESLRTIHAALERATGKLGLAAEDGAWAGYLRSVPDGEAAWQAELLKNLAAARDKKTDEAAALTTRLTDSLRSLHLATPPEQRWPLISSMLGDALAPVNLLALDLISRELSANNRPDSAIAEAVLKLVRSSDDQVREQAAILVANLAPPGAAEVLNDALEHETSPRAAAAMLAATSRWPAAAFEPSIVRWIKTDAAASNEARAARDGAIDAAWSLYRAGYLRDEESEAPIRNVLRGISLGELSGAGCQLRVEAGDASDRDAIAVLLGSRTPAQRLAAAESLVGFPEFLPRILAAARVDPLLIEVAVRGVLTQDPSLAGFVAIEEATRNAPEQRRAALTVIASVLEEDEILEAAARVDDLSLREAVIAQLADPKRIMSERTEPRTLVTVATGLLSLAELRIELNRPGDAIGAIDALPEMEKLLPPAKVKDVRTVGLILLGRMDQAREAGGSVSAWLRALDLSIRIAPERAQPIASAIETTMGDKLEQADRARLEDLKVKLAALAKK
ncbi:MAG: hypothetical protein K2Y21_12590 [Phycisphaerales bacterium]|nr:hypothetical protein [Phycisphaerales bacterium]